ncbi:MAG: CaiB/BaiF CoA transferase family protein, partial [Gammaproteobacteria bacterium]
LKGFLDGPYSSRTALDEVVQMMGGLAHMTGPPGRPLRAGSSVNDIMGGMFAAIGILAALRERDATGCGCEVKSALFENNVLLVAQHMTQYAVTGTPAAPMPGRSSAWGIYDVFDTRDGDKLFLGVVTNSQWAVFCEAFDRADLYADATLDTNAKRVASRERLLPEVRAIARQRDKDELMALCERIGLPFAPITRPEELYDDPHVNAAGGLTRVSNPEDGRTVGVPALPLEIGGERLGARRDVPRIGTGARSLLGELGMDEDRVRQLQMGGVIKIE